MVLGEVVRRREPVRAAADDDDVVVALELARPREDLLLEEDVLHALASQRVDADRPTAERGGAVDRDLVQVVAVLLREHDPVARRRARSTCAVMCATSPPEGKWCRCVRRRSTVAASAPTSARMPCCAVTSSTKLAPAEPVAHDGLEAGGEEQQPAARRDRVRDDPGAGRRGRRSHLELRRGATGRRPRRRRCDCVSPGTETGTSQPSRSSNVAPASRKRRSIEERATGWKPSASSARDGDRKSRTPLMPSAVSPAGSKNGPEVNDHRLEPAADAHVEALALLGELDGHDGEADHLAELGAATARSSRARPTCRRRPPGRPRPASRRAGSRSRRAST